MAKYLIHIAINSTYNNLKPPTSRKNLLFFPFFVYQASVKRSEVHARSTTSWLLLNLGRLWDHSFP